MQPQQSAVPDDSAGLGEPSRPLPIAQVNVGMSVVDAAGEPIGTVSAVQQPGTHVRPDAPAVTVDRLMATGYLRIDVTGLGAADAYASGEQVAHVSEGAPGVVTLTVRGEALLSRAG